MASHHSSSASRTSGCSTHTNRELLDAAVRKAELMCQMQSLKKKHELDKLDEEIRWKKELLQIETQLAMFDAKIDVLQGEDGSLSTRSSRRSHRSLASSSSKKKVESWIKENENKHPASAQPQYVLETPVTVSRKVEGWIQENRDTFREQLETLQGLDRQDTASKGWIRDTPHETSREQHEISNQGLEQKMAVSKQGAEKQIQEGRNLYQQLRLNPQTTCTDLMMSKNRGESRIQGREESFLAQREPLQGLNPQATASRQQVRWIRENTESCEQITHQGLDLNMAASNNKGAETEIQENKGLHSQHRLNPQTTDVVTPKNGAVSSIQNRAEPVLAQCGTLQGFHPHAPAYRQGVRLIGENTQCGEQLTQQSLDLNMAVSSISGAETQNCESRDLPWHHRPNQVNSQITGRGKVTSNTESGVHVSTDPPLRIGDVSGHVKQNPEDIMGKYCNQMASMLHLQQQRATLPQRHITPYNGDPLQFCTFMKAFKYGIERKCTDDLEKLYFLEELTTGEPNTLVRGFLNKDEDLAFNEAKEALTKKFGNRHIIAEAFKAKAAKWPEVKRDDIKGWSSFSIFLGEYWNTMEDLNYTGEVDHSSTIKHLICKLPYNVRNWWRMRADKVMEEEDRLVSFKDFLVFIDKQARIISNPLYGNIHDPESQNINKPKQKSTKPARAQNNRSSFKTTTKETEADVSKYCLYCEKDTHPLEVCRTLMKKPHEDRITFLKSKGLCYGCLKKGTHLCKDCTKKLQCNTCKRRHPTVLHQERRNNEDKKSDTNSNKEKAVDQEAASNVACCLTGAGEITTQTVLPVLVHSTETGEIIQVNAMLDDGSNATFCTEKLKQKLRHKAGMKTKLHINTITGDETVNTCKLKGLQLMDVNRECTIDLPEVYTRASIPANADNYPTMEDLKTWPHLRAVDLPDIEGDVDLLIGNNVPKALEPWQIIHSNNDGPFASKTLLGWTVHGLIKPAALDGSVAVNRIMVVEEIDKQLEQLYNTDFVERVIEDTPQRSIEDQMFMDKVKKSMRVDEEGHYEIGLPLRDEDVLFPNNRVLAEQRLAHLKRKFVRNSDFKEEYKDCMENTVKMGYAEPVPDEEIERNDGRTWYIPHHGVYHPQKRKLRIVYDCAAMYRGASLNGELLQGPNLTSSLIGVITRFRQAPVALISDIQAMYHQVKVPKEDRDLLRFLWWPEGDTSKPMKEYRMRVHLFGASSSPSCANFALRQTAADNGDRFDEVVVKTLYNNFYVDDCLTSVATEQEAIQLAEDLQNLCSSGGFKLTKWTSNSRKVIQSIPEEDRADKLKVMDFQDSLPVERALGVQWSAEDDNFEVKIQSKVKPVTRRGILSVMCTLYDPLGFVSPVILPAKRILQELCKLHLSWDEKIPQKYEDQWKRWLGSIEKLSHITVPRCFVPCDFGNAKSIQLHHFSDASEIGYGVVSYLRYMNENDDIHCSLVMAKGRVSPLKQTTIPRLELGAAAVAVRINHMIHKELDIPVDSTHYWTDSTTVLQYICNTTKRFKTFVANRVALIRDGSQPSQWNYVETSVNPADDCSRGQTIEKFLQNDRWINGPQFLWRHEDEWPEAKVFEEPDTDDPEVKCITVNAVNAVHVQAEESVHTLDKFFQYYSSWYKLKRAVAWILKVKQVLRQRVKQKKQLQSAKATDIGVGETNPTVNVNCNGERSQLTLGDLQSAERAIIVCVQQSNFREEIAALRNQSQSAVNKAPRQRNHRIKKSSPIYRLDPTVENGVLRVGGRLSRAAMPEEVKHPCILPKGHVVTRLILQEIHENKGHTGRNGMLAQFRQKYWATGANSTARSIVNRCVICRRQYGKAQHQKMADLPQDRVVPDDAPFTKVGVDYFGPFEVKVGRSMVKRYGIIFTCLTTRAIHLEVGDSLNTDSCINAIRRFISRRGQVQEIRSDNGSNLVSAQKELRAEINKWNQSKIANACLQKQVQWIFNPPTGSHFGGVWERLIRSVRKVLNSVANEQTLTDESLRTLFCEVEAIINGRPLTTSSEDPHDIEPLTPNHLLLMKGNPSLPPAVTDLKDQYARRRWKQVQFLADLFWRRWVREYLPQLQERQRWNNPVPNIVENDVVLIVDNSQPRGSWLMGRVMSTMPDHKGEVRSVHVKTKNGTLIRPISKLVKLLSHSM